MCGGAYPGMFCVNFNHELDQLSVGPNWILPVKFLISGPSPVLLDNPRLGNRLQCRSPAPFLEAMLNASQQVLQFTPQVCNLQMMLLVPSLFWKNFDRLNDWYRMHYK